MFLFNVWVRRHVLTLEWYLLVRLESIIEQFPIIVLTFDTQTDKKYIFQTNVNQWKIPIVFYLQLNTVQCMCFPQLRKRDGLHMTHYTAETINHFLWRSFFFLFVSAKTMHFTYIKTCASFTPMKTEISIQIHSYTIWSNVRLSIFPP